MVKPWLTMFASPGRAGQRNWIGEQQNGPLRSAVMVGFGYWQEFPIVSI